MQKFDVKHVIALVVGAVLAIAGTYFGVDFSKSCPLAPPAAAVAPAPVVPVQ